MSSSYYTHDVCAIYFAFDHRYDLPYCHRLFLCITCRDIKDLSCWTKSSSWVQYISLKWWVSWSWSHNGIYFSSWSHAGIFFSSWSYNGILFSSWSHNSILFSSWSHNGVFFSSWSHHGILFTSKVFMLYWVVPLSPYRHPMQLSHCMLGYK